MSQAQQKYCSSQILIMSKQVKVKLLLPDYNYINPLISMDIVDIINFYNPNIINAHIKLLPKL